MHLYALLTSVADIFISYSSKDHVQAKQLSELLTSAGLSVWIDRQGIDASTSWSAEIVHAIDNCKALVVLLSTSSVRSRNVSREVSLAFERNKVILPLDLEAVALTDDLAYHLAGIQRAQITNLDHVIEVLGKTGFRATPTLQPAARPVDARKSLMVLPFDDLSPTADNQWFADGLVTELIGSLLHIKQLRIADQQASKEFKSYKGQLTVYAREMGIRYFIQGSVRKFGEQIKVSSSLLDIDTGEHLWQDTLKGTMGDIFDIQEQVARKVVEGLDLILTKEEEKIIEEKPTLNSEAYEFYLKGADYYNRQTLPDLTRALDHYLEATRLDPTFADAHLNVVSTALFSYGAYAREDRLIDLARTHITLAETLEGETAAIYRSRSQLARILGNYDEALHLAQRAVELDPNLASAYDTLGFALEQLSRMEEAVEAWSRLVELKPNSRLTYLNYFLGLAEIGDTDRLKEIGRETCRQYERYLRLTPDDPQAQSEYANILLVLGDRAAALEQARKAEEQESIGGIALYNLGCFYIEIGEYTSAIRALKRAIEKGFAAFDHVCSIDTLRDIPEYQALVAEINARRAKEKTSA